jgi:hypothetical protein
MARVAFSATGTAATSSIVDDDLQGAGLTATRGIAVFAGTMGFVDFKFPLGVEGANTGATGAALAGEVGAVTLKTADLTEVVLEETEVFPLGSDVLAPTTGTVDLAGAVLEATEFSLGAGVGMLISELAGLTGRGLEADDFTLTSEVTALAEAAVEDAGFPLGADVGVVTSEAAGTIVRDNAGGLLFFFDGTDVDTLISGTGNVDFTGGAAAALSKDIAVILI